MTDGSKTPLWPFALVVVFAVTMTVTAPRYWENVAQRTALKPPVPLRPAEPRAFAYEQPAPRGESPLVGRAASAQGRVAAEYVPTTTVAPSIGPQLAPVAEPRFAPQQPAVAASIDPQVGAPHHFEEPPTVDRPRLWGGVRTAAAVVVPPVPASTPTLPPIGPATAVVATVPHREPTPIAPRIVEPAVVTPPPVAAAPPSWWPTPVDLLARLEALAGYPATQAWAEKTTATLNRLRATPGLLAPEATMTMHELRRAVAESLAIDEARLDEATAVELRLARHALVRRLDVWESLAEVERRESAVPIAAADRGAQQLEICLVTLEERTTAAGDLGRQWRDYLLLESLGLAARRQGSDVDRLRVVREALGRLRRASAEPANQAFLAQGPFAQLQDSLQLMTEVEVEPQRLLADLERFEQGGLPSHGTDLAHACSLLSESQDEAKQQLAVWLNSHYRNANVRIAIAPEIINRVLPDSLKRQAPVAETILGKEIRGWSTTRTGFSVHFQPNTDRVSVLLTAEGVVNAQTRTHAGPVRLFNLSNSNFHAEKEIELTTDGFVVKPASATSRNNTRLRNIESDFDGMPILGGIVSAIAHNQADEKKSAAQREAAWKTSYQVERNLDEEITKHLTQADEKLHQRVLDPLTRMRLSAEIIDLQTTESRAAMRLRVAGDDQPAANTPRPRSPSDCLAGIQVHESAVNNVIDRIELQGRRFTLAQLHRQVVERLGLPGTADVSKLPSELELAFAAADPLSIRFEDGRVELRMALDELRFGDRVWQNFTVRAPFRPTEIDGVTYLVRDGVVRLSGERLSTSTQIALRTVFAKVFPDDMQVRLWPESIADDPRFADLDIDHIELRDGWIGAGVGLKEVPATTVEVVHPPVPPSAILPLPRLLRK